MMKGHAIVGVLLIGARLSLAAFCRSNDPCWPSMDDWKMLNNSINGNLILLQPPMKECWLAKSEDLCQALFTNSSNADWRSSIPSAYNLPFWESDPLSGAMCFPRTDATAHWVAVGDCPRGGTPYYGVAVKNSSHISSALKFAQDKNIRIVIKSSGHDMQGRSAGDKDSLMIWMSTFTGVKIQNFSTGCSGSIPLPAITSIGGTRFGQLYKAADAAGYVVVGGTSRTVCPAGGWIQSGGHSPLSSFLGLGVDQVLQFTAVLADRTEVTASPCNRADLFWALRGGGGGSFAVVTSVTFRLHPKRPLSALRASVYLTSPTSLPFFARLLPLVS
eukprot:CAMPEP_0113669308 /NCGR_PEP_ID=MMETSP0038_2-20120614/4500_1 /TAXON_ID=2898 /ORGANISM="Cryptomonas paramecium" /LENGTH=330 /DNA_ID=CAMNT_0000585181 /DNA_START=1 /DNA_END=990 /DNA_ORIENTATION=+ /assembly_acc=CAM_ASM_000170